MKYRKTAVACGLSAMLILAGCGSTETAVTSESTANESSEETAAESENTEETTETAAVSEETNSVSGEITEVSEDSITVKTESGEEVTIPVTEDTVVEPDMSGFDAGNMQQPDQGGDDSMVIVDDSDSSSADSANGSDSQSEMPAMPSGEAPSGTDGEAPAMPSGDTQTGSSASGEAPAMPSGEAPSGTDGEAPEMPSGDTQTGSTASGEAPAMPSGEAPSGTDGEAPAMPSGDTQTGSTASGEAPAMPSGEAPSGTEGGAQMPQGNMGLSVSDLQTGTEVTVTLDEDGNAATITVSMDDMISDMSGAQPGGQAGGGQAGGGQAGGGQPGGGQSSGVESYSAAVEYTEDTETIGETYESTGTDENAVLVSNGATVNIDGATVSKVSEDSTGGDNSSFYGVGAAILTTDGTTTIKDSDISTDSAGGAGIFAYGSGIVYAIDDDITTEQGTSGGIHVAGGGTLYAWDVTAETNGESSAAVRSDRGGGTMVIDGGSFTSNGTGSPAVYCTADIAINDADLTATSSEAVCIEGLNNLHLFNCDLTGSQGEDPRNETIWNVILYQSMSGDSEVGNSTFEMQDGTLSVKDGGIFYTTNTESTFIVKNVDISSESDIDYFLRVTGNSNERGWGTAGSNGAQCTFTAIDQEMNGDIIWDSISTLDLYITGSSVLTGAVLDDESNAGNGGNGYCNVVIADGSKWIVTGDSTLTSLSCEGTITDESGKTVTVKGTDGTVYVNGDSSYTITVESYSDTADTSSAGTCTSWSDYEVEQPQ